MAKYQLPPLKDEKDFEEFICDLFNAIENTNSYTNTDFQIFGVKGQSQNGIDILSTKNKTVIQCKLKDIRVKDNNTIRKNLMEDMCSDISKISGLNIDISKFIFASTYRDDVELQKFAIKSQEYNNLSFVVCYWGWDTISKYAENHENILKKYFPQFLIKKPREAKSKNELPEGALGCDLLKKNYISYLIKRYGEWKQIELDRKNEKFNWASFNKHIMNQYKAAGINYIHINHFNNLVCYLKDRIDKTTFGRNNKSKGKRNYSEFEEHLKGIID